MRVWINTLFIIFILLLSGCKDYTIVARVGNKPIYLKEFKQEFLAENNIKQGDNIDFDRKNAFLDQMIEKRLRLFDAYDNRCDTIPSIVELLKKAEKRYIYDQVINDKVVAPIITEKDYRDRYYRVANQVRAQQIFLPLPITNRAEVKDKVFKTLDSLRVLVNKGEDFGKLARQFSRDSLTAGKGGDLGFLQWDDKKYKDVVLNFVYDMKGSREAKIVETEKGLHLVKIVQIRPVRVPELEQLKPEFQKAFYSERGMELTKQYNTFVEHLEKIYNLKWNEENITAFTTLIHNEMDSANARGEKFDPVQINKKLPTDLVLMEYDNGKYESNNFITDINLNYPIFFPGMYSTERIRDNLKRFTDRDLLIQYGYKHHYKNNKLVKERLEQLKQEQMVKALNKIIIEDSLTEDACKQYYELNKEQFERAAKYKIQEIMVKDSVLAETIYKRILNGENIDLLAIKYNERAETKAKKGVLGFFNEKQYGNIGKTVASMQIGEISGPVKNDNTFSVFKLLETVNKEDKAYSELDPKTKRIVQTALGKEKGNNMKERLNKKYPVVKYETILNRIFNEKNI